MKFFAGKAVFAPVLWVTRIDSLQKKDVLCGGVSRGLLVSSGLHTKNGVSFKRSLFFTMPKTIEGDGRSIPERVCPRTFFKSIDESTLGA